MEIANTRIVEPQEYAMAYREAFDREPPHPTAIAEIWLSDGTLLWSYGDTALEAESVVHEKLVRHIVTKWAVEVDRRMVGFPFEFKWSNGDPEVSGPK